MHVLSFITILVLSVLPVTSDTASWEVDTILMNLITIFNIKYDTYFSSLLHLVYNPIYCKLVMNCEKLILSAHTASNDPVNISLMPVDVQNVPLTVMAWAAATICSSDVGLN